MAQSDAPNYREAETDDPGDMAEACGTCAYFANGMCTAFEFETERYMLCDAFEAREKSATHAICPIDVLDYQKDGGRILINTGNPDRARDRVLPLGARVENYLKNPVVQWGHNYFDPWATIGRTVKLEMTDQGIVSEFELRPAANEVDPQNIVRLLWEGNWVRTASIGFNPLNGAANSNGGVDYTEWELLEWSLVPIPMNQDALRLAVKSAKLRPMARRIIPVERAGRVLSKTNEQKLRDAHAAIGEVLGQIKDDETEAKGKPTQPELPASVTTELQSTIAALHAKLER
jgi:HK97 family phage prohead protease